MQWFLVGHEMNGVEPSSLLISPGLVQSAGTWPVPSFSDEGDRSPEVQAGSSNGVAAVAQQRVCRGVWP